MYVVVPLDFDDYLLDYKDSNLAGQFLIDKDAPDDYLVKYANYDIELRQDILGAARHSKHGRRLIYNLVAERYLPILKKVLKERKLDPRKLGYDFDL